MRKTVFNIVIILVSFCIGISYSGRVKRCWVCRSRGELGDCKDPFPHNETTAEEVRALESAPCASGWCAKIVEGRGDDYAIATERMCLQRPPGDEEQRCADTLYQNRKVFMCFCKGDLCNGSPYSSMSAVAILSVIATWLLLL